MRSWLRRQRSWVDFRRCQREGFLRAFRRWRLYSEILKTAPVETDTAVGDTELHLLCYRYDYLGAIWALKSFYRYARVRMPLVIHVQGIVPGRVLRRLREHFPTAKLITQQEANGLVIPELQKRGLKRLLAARAANPYTLKLTDFVLLGDAPNLITIDSDVLFFRHPAELLRSKDRHLFQRDPESTYVLGAETAQSAFGIAMAERINVGMMHFRRESVSLERCDEYLAAFPNFNGWLEQTLYALHASEKGNVDYLPDDYLISLERGRDDSQLVARHYAGPSRPLMHLEGIPRLLHGWPPDIRKPPPPGTP